MEKFLVTGGAGFIGSNICRRLVADGCFVRVVDNLLTGKRSNLDGVIDKIDFVEADMGVPEVAQSVVKDIDVLLHEGALPSVPRSVDEPELTHQHCVDATFTLLMAARDADVKRFVYAASSSAYGDTPTLPKIETMPTCPLSPYAVGKLVGEYYCSVFAKVFGLQTVSLRYFNVFGPYQDPTSQYAAAIPAFVTAILKDQSPTVYGDGEQTRDFSHIENVLWGNELAMGVKTTHGEVVNLACGGQISVNQVILAINRLLGKTIEPVHVDPRPGDVKHSCADIRLAKELLGYEPRLGFDEGLEQTIEYYRTLT